MYSSWMDRVPLMDFWDHESTQPAYDKRPVYRLSVFRCESVLCTSIFHLYSSKESECICSKHQNRIERLYHFYV